MWPDWDLEDDEDEMMFEDEEKDVDAEAMDEEDTDPS